MADLLPLAELQLRIALLPPISRGAHLAGPTLHAHRLVGLWTVDDDDDVPSAQAFRLLNVGVVAGAILRSLASRGCAGDPRHWTFPNIERLLPELRELSWQEMLAGTLLTEAIKSVRGKRPRTVLPTELARLTPDWELSRLCRGANDEFISVRVRLAPAVPVKKGLAQIADQCGTQGRRGGGRKALPSRRTTSISRVLEGAQRAPTRPAAGGCATRTGLRPTITPTTRRPRQHQIAGLNRRLFLLGDLAISARLVLIRHDSVTPISKGSRHVRPIRKTEQWRERRRRHSARRIATYASPAPALALRTARISAIETEATAAGQ